MKILNGIKILDLSQNIAGPYCTQILSDMGAEVIKIERPGRGDDTRHWNLHTWEGLSTVYYAMNRNKKSVAIDIGTHEGIEVIKELIKKVDVFIHAVRPGSLEGKGLGYESLKKINGNLIYCSISAFGHKGPLTSSPGYDALIQAYSGIMSVNGHPQMPPSRVGVSILDQSTGMWAAMGILAALYRKKLTNTGALVNASLLESGISWMTLPLTHFMADGTVTKRSGDLTPMSAPYEAFKTKDGSVLIAASNDNLFGNVCDAIGRSDLKNDPKFVTNKQRILPENRSILHSIIEEKTSELNSKDCVEMMRKFRAPCEIIKTVDQVLTDEQVKALNIVRSISEVEYRGKKIIDLPITIDGVRGEIELHPPQIGVHTEEVLIEYGFTKEKINFLSDAGVIEFNKEQ